MKTDPQLRLALIALHFKVQRASSRRDFFFLLAILLAGMGAILYYFPVYSGLVPLAFVLAAFNLHKIYFIDLPRDRNLLAFFEQNHPEMCSWLEESAVLEATMMLGQKTL